MNIVSAEFVVSNSRADHCPQDGRPEYAFIGRSNVGKSSLINMLTARRGLAMTSSTPGKTMLINHFCINGEWYLVDLPGYGYARRSKEEVAKLGRLISHYVLRPTGPTCLFVLIDSRLSPQPVDLDFIHQLGAEGVPFAIVFTKADKAKVGELNRNVSAFLTALRAEWETLPPHFVTSSKTRQGREELLDYIDSINRSLKP